jgi:hypothetical protein
MRKSIFARAVFSGAAFCVLSAGAVYGGWQSETVDAAGDVGLGCALAVDRWNLPHIAYYDKTEQCIKYARYTGNRWEFETIATGVKFMDIGLTGLAIDALDTPHVIFGDMEKDEITYAYRAGGQWHTEEIDARGNDGQYVSIVAWPTSPRVTYSVSPGTVGLLKYASRGATDWQTETVTGMGHAFNKIFINNDAVVNVVSFYTPTATIRFAKRDTGGWVVDDIAEGIDCHAVLGPENKVHVSFAGVGYRGLNYAVSTEGGSWDVENIDNVVGSPASTQVAVNAAGNVFITYFDYDKHNLHVMTKIGGTWTHDFVSIDPYVGLPHSTVIAGAYPLVAYYDAMNGDLKLARYDPLSGVELTSFTAERSRAGADVRWAVSSDGGTAGYNLYRAAAGSGRAKLNSSLITGSSPLLFRDAAVENAVSYRYWLELVSLTGTKHTYGPVALPPAGEAHAFALRQNVPNPAYDSTTFSFELAESAYVKLAIYDAAGRKVADVADGSFAPGKHDVLFAGKLAPGIYIYRLDAGGESAARKMVVAR